MKCEINLFLKITPTNKLLTQILKTMKKTFFNPFIRKILEFISTKRKEEWKKIKNNDAAKIRR